MGPLTSNGPDMAMYGDLDKGLTEGRAKGEASKWKARAKKFAAMVKPREAKIKKLLKQNEILARNLSSLFKTAKNELERRVRVISDLRKQVATLQKVRRRQDSDGRRERERDRDRDRDRGAGCSCNCSYFCT